MLRNLLKSGVALGLSQSGVARFLGSGRNAGDAPLIVGYHRVVQDFERSAMRSIPPMLISARMLEKQLDWLGGHYRLVSLHDLGKWLEEGRAAAGIAAVTFDDGYGDVYENAFPILKRKGIPATIFVVTEMIGTPRSMDHDRLYALLALALADTKAPAGMLAGLHAACGLRVPDSRVLSRAARTTFTAMRLLLETLPQPALLGVIAALESRFGVPGNDGDRALTWEMIDEMGSAGVTIGSHGRTHALLTHASQERRQDEISGSRQMLEARLKTPIEHLAYPDGRFDSGTVIATAAAGYRFAYTTCRHRDPAFPLLTLPRRVLWEHASVDARGGFSAAVLDCLVRGVFDRLSPCRQTHGPGLDDQAHLRTAWSGTAA
ncbi:MAG TPA: polysaccharide deacetylase family protein [Candidatus Polarisedimenticolia bacterium]|nr:polysaccharide deacetylase family protein [Candidatus Polarisedimenticolia bacterium]